MSTSTKIDRLVQEISMVLLLGLLFFISAAFPIFKIHEEGIPPEWSTFSIGRIVVGALVSGIAGMWILLTRDRGVVICMGLFYAVFTGLAFGEIVSAFIALNNHLQLHPVWLTGVAELIMVVPLVLGMPVRFWLTVVEISKETAAQRLALQSN